VSSHDRAIYVSTDIGVKRVIPSSVFPPPQIENVNRASKNPTTASSVDFIVTFTKPVTGVDVSDFYLKVTGTKEASITDVLDLGSETTYKVSVDISGTGSGTLRLEVVDNDTIIDATFFPLGGPGIHNGNFTAGEIYYIVTDKLFNSTVLNDGWTLESSETSSVASTKSSNGTLRVGDDARNRQYRSLLYFDTSDLLDKAVITKVTLLIKKAGLVSDKDIFTTHGNLVADMKNGFFGLNKLLELSDFQSAAAPISTAGKFTALVPAAPEWYQLTLGPLNFQYVNVLGVTQFRLRFMKDDDNDKKADFISFYAGDAAATDQPQLIIEYYVP
jgi:hypothetical protein